MKEELLAKLEELKKQYPERTLRALLIEDDNLNFTITMRKWVGSTIIESHNFNGIMYQQIIQDKTLGGDKPAVKVGLIVAKYEFLLSSSRAYALLMEYGI
ncbi:hypothetical protein AB9M75_08015 [Lactobacillus sp. AN1001]